MVKVPVAKIKKATVPEATRSKATFIAEIKEARAEARAFFMGPVEISLLRFLFCAARLAGQDNKREDDE